MASDHRDRDFEKTLARHLRARHLHAQNPSASGATPDDCPDVETLAAYHERLLSPEEMIFWKRHIPACQRCVQILAELEATDDLSVDILDEKNLHLVPAMAASSASSQTAPGAAPVTVLQSNLPSKMQSQPQEIRRQPRFHPSRWILPAAALAAGFFVYIALHNKPRATSAPASVEVAENRTPSPQPAPPAPTPQTSASASIRTEPKVSAPPATRNAPPQKSSPAPVREKEKQDAQIATGSPTHDFSADLRAQAPQQQVDGIASANNRDQFTRNRIDSATGKMASAPTLKKEAEDKTKRSDSLALAQPQALPKPSPPISTNETVEVIAQSATVETGASSAPPSDRLITKGAVGGAMYRNAAAGSLSLVPAPGGIVIWRAGAAGILERSTDSGVTWKIQPSGVIANLLAGSAPSEKTCWIAGATGVILLTTDAGEHWQKIPPPVAEDFTSVFAVDARQATVTTALRHQSYKTTDGGRTWKLIANP